MFNATVTITRNGESIDQTTGRRAAETAVVILQDADCTVSQSKSSRIKHTDGIREIVKPSYALSIETYEDITIHMGDIAHITMRDATSTETYTINDSILSLGIRRRRWNCEIERIKVPAANA